MMNSSALVPLGYKSHCGELSDVDHKPIAIPKVMGSIQPIKSAPTSSGFMMSSRMHSPAPDLRTLVQEKNILIVANRGPSIINNALSTTPGGLGTAITDSLNRIADAQEEHRSVAWISWDGNKCRGESGKLEHYSAGKGVNQFPFDVINFSIKSNLFDQFYREVSNQVIWPACHEELDAIIPCSKAAWSSYSQANELFADNTVKQLKPDQENVIWCQDYQLILAPGKIRAMTNQSGNSNIKKTKIGYFHHIIWPEYSALLRCLGGREDFEEQDIGLQRIGELVSSLLQCNLVGFHVSSSANNFLALFEDEKIQRALLHRLGADALSVDRETGVISLCYPEGVSSPVRVQVVAEPIGIKNELVNHVDIDVPDIKKTIVDELLAKHASNNQFGMDLKTSAIFRDPQTVVCYSIERCDPIKNAVLRMDAIGQYLERQNSKDKALFVMTLAPSRDDIKVYQDYQRAVYEKISDLNKYYSNKLGYTPIVLTGELGKEKEKYMQSADVLIVNSKKDGMNLTLFEYILARGKTKQPMDAVVSVAAGVGERIKLRADNLGLPSPVTLIHDPNDLQENSEAIHKAIVKNFKIKQSMNSSDSGALRKSYSTGDLAKKVASAEVSKSDSLFNAARLRHFMRNQNVDTWLAGNLKALIE